MGSKVDNTSPVIIRKLAVFLPCFYLIYYVVSMKGVAQLAYSLSEGSSLAMHVVDSDQLWLLILQFSIILVGGFKAGWKELGRYPFRIRKGEFCPSGYGGPALGESRKPARQQLQLYTKAAPSICRHIEYMHTHWWRVRLHSTTQLSFPATPTSQHREQICVGGHGCACPQGLGSPWC